jgi:hypothetical protein
VRAFESRVLRKIFWLKREEVIGGLKIEESVSIGASQILLIIY